jgi:hypothetical protein
LSQAERCGWPRPFKERGSPVGVCRVNNGRTEFWRVRLGKRFTGGSIVSHYRWKNNFMGNNRDITSEYFEAKGVSRGEFEALKRFGDYEELGDGTLMRMEGNKEFRIYCEDSGWLRDSNGGRG